ncbi:MAG TPA: hypothetical protein VLC98_13205 [Phnomibacter sp.]|nr:hypothetical protein [Phnomibacter sp.]
MQQETIEQQKATNKTIKIIALLAILAGLVFSPAPLLPPHFLAEKIQALLHVQWNVAYMLATIGCQTIFYFSIGMLAAFAVQQQASWRKRLSQVFYVPLLVVLISLLIRSLKMGHFPIWINAIIPIAAILVGSWLGLGFLYRRSILSFTILLVVLGISFLALTTSATPELSKATAFKLQQLSMVYTSDTSGDVRFSLMMKKAFEQNANPGKESAVQHNRAALLALGIAIGHEHLANYVNLEEQHALLMKAAQLRESITLRDRNDWSRHFCLSAAIAVLENPLVSDAGGLLKEQMDGFTGGSGFSFADFAADRAGVRFAMAATHSEEDALAMQQFITGRYDVGYIFPVVSDLPEHMSITQFREKFGSTGSTAYRAQVAMIENRLDSCKALSPLLSEKKN